MQTYMQKNGLALHHGTVVVWVHGDRLTYKKEATLREHIVEDFGVTYQTWGDSQVTTTVRVNPHVVIPGQEQAEAPGGFRQHRGAAPSSPSVLPEALGGTGPDPVRAAVGPQQVASSPFPDCASITGTQFIVCLRDGLGAGPLASPPWRKVPALR